jgi:hypothetical protein
MKVNFFYFVVSILLVLAGFFIGISTDKVNIIWIPEFKIGDLVAVAVGFITFIFAYKGFEDNRKQHNMAIRPLIRAEFSADKIDYEYQVRIKNLGLGAAIDIKNNLQINDLKWFITKTLGDDKCELIISNSCGLQPGESSTILHVKFSKINGFQFKKFLSELQKIEIEILYISAMDESFIFKTPLRK